MDQSIEGTLAAACDAILPGSASDRAHEHVAKLFDHALPGFSFVVAGLLDSFAGMAEPGLAFSELDDEQRGQVFALMAEQESTDIRDALDGLFLFTLGMHYSEASPKAEQTWERIGYHGPSKGIPGIA